MVMVGEIRDLETAELPCRPPDRTPGVSTLHTNTAIGAMMRLKDMGD